MPRLLALWRRHPVVTTSFLAAALLTAVFMVRAVSFAVYWADPAHRDQLVEPWMTPRYVAHSWELPREVLLQTLELPPRSEGRPPRMGALAAERGWTMEELNSRIEDAAAAHRAAPRAGGQP